MSQGQTQNLLPAPPAYVQPNWRQSQFLCIKGTTCFAMLLCIICVVLASNTANFSMDTWSRIGGDTKNRTFGLFSCKNGPADERGASWSCLSRHACHESQQGLCETAKRVYAAGSSFLSLELFAMMFALMIVERVLYMCFTQPYGWCGIVYCLASWVFITHLTAIAFWFGISEAEFDVACDTPPSDSYDSWHVCAEKGPLAATVGIGIGAIGGLSTCFMQFHRPPEVDKTSQPIGRTKICGKRATSVALIVLLVMLAQLGLMIANLSVSSWVRTAGSSGSLFSLSSWQDFDHFGYDCIKASACTSDSQSGICNSFTYLHSAGIAYTGCMVVALYMFVFHMQSIVHYFFGFEFGVPLVNYLYGALCGGAQTLGLVLWTAVAGAGFSGNCDHIPDEDSKSDLDVCLSSGFYLSLSSIILYWCSYAFWAYAYSKRK